MSAVARPSAPAWQPATQLELEFAPDTAGITRLVRRRVRYPYTLLKPFWFGDHPKGIATLPLQSGSGGLFAGERLAQHIVARAGSSAHITTQAATVVHGSDSRDPATQAIDIDVRAGAYVEYLPEPVVLFPGAALEQRIRATVAPDAVLVYADGCVLHAPPATGGVFDCYANTFEARDPTGVSLCVDRMRISGSDMVQSLAADGRTRGACGALFVLANGRGALLEQLVGTLNAHLVDGPLAANGDVYAAAGLLPHGRGAWCRIVAVDGRGLRDALECGWRTVREALCGSPPPRRRK